MLTVDEIYYLNKALDGKKIYGINKNFDITGEKDKEGKIIKNLIEEKILNEDGSLNELSYQIIRNIEQYKNASNYLWINDIIFSMDKSKYLIFFRKEGKQELTFKKTTKELMLLALVKEYKFLWDNTIVTDEIKKIPLDEFIKNIAVNRRERKDLYIKKVKENRPYLYNIYYEDGESVYKYDAIKEELKTVNPKEVRVELAKILEIEGN